MKLFKTLIMLGVMNLIAVGCNQTESITPTDSVSPTDSALPFDTDRWVNPWVEIWNTFDLDQVDKLFLQDDRVNYFSSEREGLISGVEALIKHHEGFDFVPGGKELTTKLWLEDIETTQFGSTAVVSCIWFFERDDGRIQRGPATFVYVQVGDEYRIAHVNVSNYLDEE